MIFSNSPASLPSALSKNLMPLLWTVFDSCLASLALIYFPKVTQEPRDKAKTVKPDLPKRRYPIYISCVLICRHGNDDLP
jgi:hypothetical protein